MCRRLCTAGCIRDPYDTISMTRSHTTRSHTTRSQTRIHSSLVWYGLCTVSSLVWYGLCTVSLLVWYGLCTVSLLVWYGLCTVSLLYELRALECKAFLLWYFFVSLALWSSRIMEEYLLYFLPPTLENSGYHVSLGFF